MIKILRLESLSFHRKQIFDVGTSGKDSFQVNPSSLYINPHIEKCIDSVEFVFPSAGFLFKHLKDHQMVSSDLRLTAE